MDAGNPVQDNYDKNADAYDQFITTPLGTLEQQLFNLSIKDCDGLKVLDLGGGTGLRARDALNAGARVVDVVDISREMMRRGQEYEIVLRGTMAISRSLSIICSWACTTWSLPMASSTTRTMPRSLRQCGTMQRRTSSQEVA